MDAVLLLCTVELTDGHVGKAEAYADTLNQFLDRGALYPQGPNRRLLTETWGAADYDSDAYPELVRLCERLLEGHQVVGDRER